MAAITLDSSKYKQATVSRGLLYNFYSSPPRNDKPTLLFLHGYPSTSADWAGVVAVLEPQGYGILVPDMLGYGGTDKPTDPALYVASGIVRDVLDLLDAEGVEKAVAIGHDWGSFFVSRLANLHADRFLSFGFITMGYTAPYPDVSLLDKVKAASEKLGYNVFGYFPLFANQDNLIEQHIDSYIDLCFPKDEWNVHRYHLCPPGAAQAWLEADTRCARLTSAVATPEWYAAQRELFTKGMAPPNCYYKVQVSGLAQADEKAAAVPSEAYYLHKPVFFAACSKDSPTAPPIGDESFRTYAKGPVTRREYDSGHWVMLTHYEQLGKDLAEWLTAL